MKRELKRKQVCKYCRRSFRATDRSVRENPFCAKCLDARLSTAARAMGTPRIVYGSDGYAIVTWLGGSVRA